MSHDEDVSQQDLRSAAASCRRASKERAAAVGGVVVFAHEGRLIEERSDGRRIDRGPSTARTVVVAQRVWTIG
jgi:hypothetical protein